jgi:hypothetical protein
MTTVNTDRTKVLQMTIFKTMRAMRAVFCWVLREGVLSIPAYLVCLHNGQNVCSATRYSSTCGLPPRRLCLQTLRCPPQWVKFKLAEALGVDLSQLAPRD